MATNPRLTVVDNSERLPLLSDPQCRVSVSYHYCEQIARRCAANFYHAFRLLPAKQRSSMCALYAFLRISDDLADEPGEPTVIRASLQQWRLDFEDAMKGIYRHPLHPALHDTVEQHQIPVQYLREALDGVEMDGEINRYDTFDDLYQYCYRVASVVGLSCIHIWGFNDSRALELAESAGIAFQLTNILRDLREDIERDRIYLPSEDFERFGYTEQDLRQRRRTPEFEQFMQFQVERAHDFYRRSESLKDYLSRPGKAVFLVMHRTYRGLLSAIEKNRYNVFDSRIRLSRWKKLWLVLQILPVRWGLY